MSRCEALRLHAGFASFSAALLCACVSSSGASHAPAAGVPHAPAAGASYDWHGLILVPFGTLLKDTPLALHEVLLFQDAAHVAGYEGGDCYAVDGAPPPFFAGRRPDDYLLCFVHDRLTRIEASVRLPAESAEPVFAAACAQWQSGGTPVARTTVNCDGREGATGFSARLGADGAQDPAQSTMTIRLFNVPAEL